MTTAGNNITKANIVDQFEAARNSINSLIVWSAGSHPFNPAASNDYGSNNPAQGGAEAVGELDPNIGDTIITASTIVNQFRNYSVALSRIRYCRLIRYYNTQGSNGVTYDDTQITATGRTDFQRGMDDVSVNDVAASNTISAGGIDAFVSNLSSTIAGHRNSTLTFSEYYCHSSCHGSCHGSI